MHSLIHNYCMFMPIFHFNPGRINCRDRKTRLAGDKFKVFRLTEKLVSAFFAKELILHLKGVLPMELLAHTSIN